MTNEIKKDLPETTDEQAKVLDLQDLVDGNDAAGGRAQADWSTSSNNCGTVGSDEWSTVSNGCR